MKLLMLGIALIACLSVFAQDQPTAGHSFEVFRIRDGFRVVVDNARVLEAIARSIETVKTSDVVRFKGNVEITIDGVELRADEVDYHWATDELEPLGNVHVKPVAQ
jgi:lipopolysaccharide assembly outer membrane protein LptD (OstA)